MVLATIPSLILSFITAPFVTSIKLWPIPPHARHSLTALRAFAGMCHPPDHYFPLYLYYSILVFSPLHAILIQTANLPATTKVTFQTLRIFPMPKHTTVYAHELRALPPHPLRFANIVLPKSEAWKKRQSEKPLWKGLWEFIEEKRFKFYVKEGRAYTMRTGVPGVWEEVANGIKERSEQEKPVKVETEVATRSAKTRKTTDLKRGANKEERKRPVLTAVKRQTARPLMKSK